VSEELIVEKTSVTRAAGVITTYDITLEALSDYLVAGSDNYYYFYSSGNMAIRMEGGDRVVESFATDAPYRTSIVHRASGAFYYVQSDNHPEVTLLGVDSDENGASYDHIFDYVRGSGTCGLFAITDAGAWSPTPLASDSFDRTDNSDLGQTDDAAVGETGSTLRTWVKDAGDFEIDGDKLKSVTVSGVAMATVDVDESDVVVQGTFNHGFSNRYAGFTVRAEDEDNFWYVILYDDSNVFRIFEYVAGSPTQRDSTSATISGDHDVMISVDGDEIFAFLDGDDRIDFSPMTSGLTATKHGAAATLFADSTWDDFVIWERHPSDFPAELTQDYLLRDEFEYDDPAPLNTPHYCSPGPGILIGDELDGERAVSNGQLNWTGQTTASWGDLEIASAAGFARTPGRMLLAQMSAASAGGYGPFIQWGAGQNGSPASVNGVWYPRNDGQIWGDTGLRPLVPYTVDTTYHVAIICRASGYFTMHAEGSGNMKLLWVDDSASGDPLYVVAATYNSDGTTKDLRVPTTAWTPTPLASDGFAGTAGETVETTDGAGVEESGGGGLVWETAWTTSGVFEYHATRGVHLSAQSGGRSAAVVETGKSDVVLQASGEGDFGTSHTFWHIRYADIDNNWRVHTSVAGDYIKLYQRTGGSDTERDTASVTVDADVVYDVILIADGQDISAYMDGVHRLEYDSADFNETITKHGIGSFNTSNYFDNFVVWPRYPVDFPRTL
jgi:hypothetical protein